MMVLDLDETLIHSHHDGVLRQTVKPGTPPDFVLKVVTNPQLPEYSAETLFWLKQSILVKRVFFGRKKAIWVKIPKKPYKTEIGSAETEPK